MRIQKLPLRRFLQSVALLFGTIIVGVSGFHWFEGYNFLDALYMTVTTMSTVGFGILEKENYSGLTDEGKVFVIFLIIFTIGTFFYVVSTLTSFIIEGEVRRLLRGYRVNKEISKLRSHVIICGLGRNGREAAYELLENRQSFVIVEQSQEVIDDFIAHHNGILAIQDNATSEEALQNANVAHARAVITALPSDADNIFATLTVKELNPDAQIISRASTESTITKLMRAGADRVILPNKLGGRKMAKIVTKPALVDFIDMITGEGGSHFHLRDIDCSLHNEIVGKTLKDLNIRSLTGALVLGIQQQNGTFQLNPPADKLIQTQEKLFLIGTEYQLEQFNKLFLA